MPGVPFRLFLERQKIALEPDLLRMTYQGKGLFWVLSFNNNLNECYRVDFENEHETPKCSSNDWGKAGSLCKQFSQFLKNFHHSQESMHYHWCILTVLFWKPWQNLSLYWMKTPFQMPLLQKKKAKRNCQ